MGPAPTHTELQATWAGQLGTAARTLALQTTLQEPLFGDIHFQEPLNDLVGYGVDHKKMDPKV